MKTAWQLTDYCLITTWLLSNDYLSYILQPEDYFTMAKFTFLFEKGEIIDKTTATTKITSL